MFLVLYVDDILLIGNDIGVMSLVKVWLSSQFDMKDLGEANFILGIKLWRDCKNKILGLSQTRYIDKVLEQFSMQNSKKGLLLFRHGVPLSDDQRSKTLEEVNMMRQVSYASTVGSLMYATGYLLFSWHGQLISIKFRTKNLASCKAYSQISMENERIYVCLLV